MARRKRETDEERALRERRDRIELLKMKQGLIEESEAIPESGYAKMPELHGWAKVSNFFYLNKWFIVLGVFFAALIALFTYQIVTREKEDLYVLALAFSPDSEIGIRAEDIELALEKYCPDFDGNGKVHVLVNFINLTSKSSGVNQFNQAQEQKFTAEFMNGSAQLYITDESFIDWMTESGETSLDPKEVFLDQSAVCSEEMLFNGYGVRANKTNYASDANWSSCPDNVIFLVRDELINGIGNEKQNAVSRERALIVMQNIIDGNVINPETPDE